MKKEPIIAVVLGGLLGLGVAFAVWQFSKASSNHKEKSSSESIVDNKNNTITEGLSLVEPLEYSVSGQDQIEISGLTYPETLVGIMTESDTQLIFSNSSGEFSTEIELSGGLNDISVWAFPEGKIPPEIFISVVYTSQLNADSSEEKLDVIAKNLTFYLGTVTDISESTIQIRTATDEIEQIITNDDSSFANIVKSTNEITLKEVAIGDYIICIGTLNGNSAMNAQRVLVTTESEETNLIAIQGEILTLSNSEFIVKDIKNEYSIDAKGGVVITKLKNGELVNAKLGDSSEGERIIVLGTMEEEIDADQIHIFPQDPKE